MLKLAKIILATLFIVLHQLSFAHAQAPSIQAPLTVQINTGRDLINFANDYTAAIITGVIVGGVVMNLFFARSSAAILGSIVGSIVASAIFMREEAERYINEHAVRLKKK